ncbi:FAD-binding oxidoreductase [Acidocella sp.]|uniref:FAD-binding oxidoreductase n=1 Tax=Acidocella sp. TaxID=50710 RepID=UPI002609D1EB|nr:FAD-binding oxidoreductase [Acidocella sp.]MDD2794725.1 FAD-binding oxidoreductase [Acidocella sp.]
MALFAALREIAGEGAVLTAPADRAAYETDWRQLSRHTALCAVMPQSTAEVAAIVKLCAGAGVKIVPQGGNTGLVAGGVPAPGGNQIILNLRRLHQIRALDPVGDTITAEAGATLHAVREAAARANKLFPISFGAEGSAQIGGIVSTNAGGMQVLSYGSTRAQVLGLEAVLADGRIWNGLGALRKDNTGLDLKQLFIGAEGTLGIITAATLRLYPAPGAQACALAGVADVAAALELFTRLRRQCGPALTLCEFIGGPAMQLGAAHTPGGRLPFAAPAYVLLELSALDAAATPTATLERLLGETLESGLTQDAVIAQSTREAQNFIAMREAVSEGELREGGAVKHDIAVPLAAIPEAVAAIEALVAEKYPDCRLNIFGHLGDGNLHINIRPPAGQTLASLATRKAAITTDIEALAVARGGSFSAEHGIGQFRLAGMRAHKSAVDLDLMRALKAALDPQNLLNPGKLLPEKDLS